MRVAKSSSTTSGPAAVARYLTGGARRAVSRSATSDLPERAPPSTSVITGAKLAFATCVLSQRTAPIRDRGEHRRRQGQVVLRVRRDGTGLGARLAGRRDPVHQGPLRETRPEKEPRRHPAPLC